MADPIDPTSTAANMSDLTDSTDKAAAGFTNLGDQAVGAGVKLGSIDGITAALGGAFSLLKNKLADAGISLSNLGNLGPEQASKLGMITTAILGVKESYTNLAGLDTSRLNTFSGQISHLMEIIKQGPGTSMATDAIKSLTDKMTKMGAPAGVVKVAIDELKKGVTTMADAFFVSADNALRLQDGMFRLTMQSGGAGALFDKLSDSVQGIGDNFENLDQVSQMYNARLIETREATHLTMDQVANYAAMVTKMPGGLKSLMDSQGVTTESTNILTDSIRYAVGAGRDEAEVFDDMSKAMSQYGMSGDSALKFTARMTEVSDTLHARISDVHGALMQSAEAFKNYVGAGSGPNGAAAMTQGMSRSMEEYVARLTSVGVPVQNAIDMFKKYTDTMHGMTVGQKAFLSAQSGGVGGLQGSFQIDAMLKKGDFEGVRKMTESTLKKMTGSHIVSLDEATKSQSAAATYQKQLMILQQGPLGAQAKTQEEAENLLESMRKGEAPKLGADDTKVAQQSLEKTVDRGVKWQERTHSVIRKTNERLDALIMLASNNNLKTAQAALASGASLGGGTDEKGGGLDTDRQEMLRSGTAGASGTQEGVFRDLGSIVSDMPMAVKGSMKSFMETMSGGSKGGNSKSADEVMRTIDLWKQGIKDMPKDQQEAAMKQADNASNLISQAKETKATRGIFGRGFETGEDTTQTLTPNTNQDYTPAGQQVGKAVPTSTTHSNAHIRPGASPTAAAAGGAGGAQPIPVTLVGSNINVNVTSTCPHCGRSNTSSQTGSVNVAANT